MALSDGDSERIEEALATLDHFGVPARLLDPVREWTRRHCVSVVTEDTLRQWVAACKTNETRA